MPPDATPVRLCADLPGTGGAFKLSAEDFCVDEIPTYLPSGEGTHLFVWVEKTELTTPEAAKRLAAALGADPRAAGTAGLKDKQARTRQWISFDGADPERALALGGEVPGIRVLEARRHPHKLRTGHLAGNRFAITLRGCDPDGHARATTIARRLASGMPNYYGEQRFGRDAQNAERGRALLARRLYVRDARERRLLVSALQSALFNAVLTDRISMAEWGRVHAGDVLERVQTGGLFVCTDAALDQTRRDSGEIEVTGPMFGPEMMRPAAGSLAAECEARVMADWDLSIDAFARAKKLAPGTRRALAVRPTDLSVEQGESPDVLRLRFALPAGSYATVLLREIIG